MRVRGAYVERSTGEILLGPLKSRAGRRVVGIPAAVIPQLRDHLAVFFQAEPDALVFPGPKGGPLRRSNFNRLTGWPHAVRLIGGRRAAHPRPAAHGQHVRRLQRGGLRDLKVRMGHYSERAALIYQREAPGADQRITGAIDAHVQAEKAKGQPRRGRPGRRVAG